MVQRKVGELKEGDTILIYGEKARVKKIETSGKGIKQGRVKCRIEAELLKDKTPTTIIRLADDPIEVA